MFSALRTATLALILAVAAIAIISLPAQASDPAAGTWELNLAKSKFTNIPAYKRQTRTYEVTGQQVKMTGKGIDAQGKPTLIGFTANTDGKDYPYTGSALHDTISLTPVDALTANWTGKKAGKVVTTGARVISKDGKVMTISGKVAMQIGQVEDLPPEEIAANYDRSQHRYGTFAASLNE